MAGATTVGRLSPQRSNSEYWEMLCVFDIGASGAHTLVYGKGMSVARTAAGKYTVTFTGGSTAILLDLAVTVWRADATERVVAGPTDGSFTAATAAADATVKYETWKLDGTSALEELASGDRVTITAKFLKST